MAYIFNLKNINLIMFLSESVKHIKVITYTPVYMAKRICSNSPVLNVCILPSMHNRQTDLGILDQKIVVSLSHEIHYMIN